MSEEKSRWDEIRQIHIESATAYRILGGIALVGIGVLVGANLFAVDKDGYSLNVYTEALGVVATVLIVDTLYRYRDEQRREQNLKDRLLREICSPEPDVVRSAFHEIRRRKKMFGEKSILKGEMLKVARPGTVDLSYANLSGADLSSRDLQGFMFVRTNFSGANLARCKLNSAPLTNANLENANLEGAWLNDAILLGANLKGANLQNANFENATLLPSQVMTDEDLHKLATMFGDATPTTLPNNCPAKDTDLSRFTDPNHPQPWRSCDPRSPAFCETEN